MNREEAIEIINNTIPEADAPIVFNIIDRTIEIMKLKPVMSDEEYLALPKEQQYKELVTRRLCSFKFSEDVRCIFIRFVGDETPLAQALFFPIEAVWSFLDEARHYFNTPGTTLTVEEIEKYSFNKAVDMFSIMLRIIYPRMMATMDSITVETINEWHRQQSELYREIMARQGEFIPSNQPIINKVNQNALKDYSNEVKNVWGIENKRFENYKKIRFAEEYEILFSHWNSISLLYRGKGNWLAYAKINDFEDTPDDLLDELKGSHHRGISSKALEHAARRVNLINLDSQDEEILEKRKNNIIVSGFSENTLFKYLDEGRKFIKMFQTQQLTSNTSSDVKQLKK